MARHDFLQKNQFSFEPEIIFEDIPYTFEVLLRAERVMALNEVLVKRRIRDNSLEHRPTTVHRCKSAFRSLILDYKLVRHSDMISGMRTGGNSGIGVSTRICEKYLYWN